MTQILELEIQKYLNLTLHMHMHIPRTHTCSSCRLCLNELENWSLESHLSEQSEMRL